MNQRPDRDAVLAEIVERQQEKDLAQAEADAKDEAARALAGRRPLMLLAVAIPALIVLTAWNAHYLTREPAPPFTRAEEAESAAFDVFVTASEIQAYQREHGSLPATLADVGEDAEDIRYRRSGNGFELTVIHGDAQLTYRSGDDLNQYGAAVDAAADAAIAVQQRELAEAGAREAPGSEGPAPTSQPGENR